MVICRETAVKFAARDKVRRAPKMPKIEKLFHRSGAGGSLPNPWVSEKIDQFAQTGALKAYFHLARRVERVWGSDFSPESQTTPRFPLRPLRLR